MFKCSPQEEKQATCCCRSRIGLLIIGLLLVVLAAIWLFAGPAYASKEPVEAPRHEKVQKAADIKDINGETQNRGCCLNFGLKS